MSEGTRARLATLTYNALVRTSPWARRGVIEWLWNTARRAAKRRFSGPVATTVHGRSVVLNYGNPYPLTTRRYGTFGNPVVELVYQSFMAKGRGVNLLDVGAAFGDTILLVLSNCPGMISRFFCVDGDSELFGYLQRNLGTLSEGTLLMALLSDSEGTEKGLVHIHAGTASAQGSVAVPCTTLDVLVDKAAISGVDVLKTDVDGMDGRVLLGSRKTLERCRPSVVFEWHPLLCQQTGNNWTDHFSALLECGYQRFIWFDKYGRFSHLSRGFDADTVRLLADICNRGHVDSDQHYDVVALHESSPISEVSVAETAFARAKRSQY